MHLEMPSVSAVSYTHLDVYKRQCDNRPVNNLYHQMGAQQYSFTQMEGSAVYKFAVRTVPHAISEALEKAGVPVDRCV